MTNDKPNKGRGHFQPCATCDRPQLCETIRPRTQPCWYARVPIGLLEEARDALLETGAGALVVEIERRIKDSG